MVDCRVGAERLWVGATVFWRSFIEGLDCRGSIVLAALVNALR